MIETKRIETVEERVARADTLLASWRTADFAYLVLLSNGRAMAEQRGKLRLALTQLKHDPNAQIIELADPQCREFFIAWAIAPRRRKAN